MLLGHAQELASQGGMSHLCLPQEVNLLNHGVPHL